MQSWRSAVGLILVCGLAACDSTDDDSGDDLTEITVLVAYTPAAADTVGDIRSAVDAAIAGTNAAYKDSNISIRLKLAHLVKLEYRLTERLQDLERLLRENDGHLDEIHELRDRYEADIGVLLAEERNATINGAVMADESTAFAVVHVGTMGPPDYALAHEIGHLQGGRHTPDRDANQEPYPFGHAFRNDEIRTIVGTGGQRIVPYFSGPDQVYEQVVLGDSTLRNNAEVLRLSAVYISNFRGRVTPTDFVPPSTWPTIDLK
jgi:hypothetical protein